MLRDFKPKNRLDFLARLCCHRLMKISLCLSVLLMLLTVSLTHAGSATWNLNPTSGNWNTAGNWTPATVPNGPGDIATFDVSNTTDVALAASITLNGIIFN